MALDLLYINIAKALIIIRLLIIKTELCLLPCKIRLNSSNKQEVGLEDAIARNSLIDPRTGLLNL